MAGRALTEGQPWHLQSRVAPASCFLQPRSPARSPGRAPARRTPRFAFARSPTRRVTGQGAAARHGRRRGGRALRAGGQQGAPAGQQCARAPPAAAAPALGSWHPQRPAGGHPPLPAAAQGAGRGGKGCTSREAGGAAREHRRGPEGHACSNGRVPYATPSCCCPHRQSPPPHTAALPQQPGTLAAAPRRPPAARAAGGGPRARRNKKQNNEEG